MLILSTVVAPAATYYVANDGDDVDAGTSEAAPWRTIGHAASQLRSGDTLLLRRGDVFRETTSIGATNVTVDGYGQVDPPVVSGAEPVTGWTHLFDDVWMTELTGSIGYVYADGELMTLARWPNTGWARTRSWTEDPDGSNTVIRCDELVDHPNDADGYWTGAQIRWRRHSWWFEVRPIVDYTSSAGGYLHLADASLIHVMPGNMNGWGFYLDNKFEELDYPGEYYYDVAAGRLFFYPPGGADPNTMLVEVSRRDSGLSVNGSTVRNVAFAHQRNSGLSITGSSLVEGCRFEAIGSDAGGAALRATWGVNNATVRDNVFRNNLNVAINWNEDTLHTAPSHIEHNTLINTGVVDGYGGEGPWHAAGIVVPNAGNLHVRYNRIDATGYAGIIFGKPGNVAEYNVIDNAMSTLNDGAAIYTNCDHSIIRDNIIRDTRGGMESSGPWANLAHGIWTEFLAEFKDQVIVGNTVLRSGGFGIFFENNFTSEVRDNLFFDCDRAQFFLAGRDDYTPQDHVIRDNILFAATADQRTLLFETAFDYGTVDGNYYINLYTDTHITPATASWRWEPPITLAEFQSQYAWADANGKLAPMMLSAPPTLDSPRGTPAVFVNDTEAVKTVDLGDGQYMDLDGNTVTGTLTLDPFRSRVLLVEHYATGDVNGDATVDAADIDALHAALRQGTAATRFDLDGDGDVDTADVDVLVRTILDSEYGDATLDGRVDLDDFVALKTHFGAADAGWADGDFDGDADVDLDDFVLLKSHFGT
ncbi:MAG: right-handed parallel beta-helix repeat-containing protein [Planctomycetota bacterium]